MKLLPLLLSFWISLAFLSCGGDSEYEWDDLDLGETTTTVDIDNGTDTTAIVELKSLEKDTTYHFEIEGLGMNQVTLPYGKYHVKAETVTDSLIIDEDFELKEDEYVYYYNLNLTKEDYIVENIEYIVGATGDEVLNSSFTYEGKTYDGVDADVIKGQLVVPKQWDYNLDEESPDEVTLYEGESSTTKRKLYRASTFILYLELIELFENYSEEEAVE